MQVKSSTIKGFRRKTSNDGHRIFSSKEHFGIIAPAEVGTGLAEKIFKRRRIEKVML